MHNQKLNIQLGVQAYRENPYFFSSLLLSLSLSVSLSLPAFIPLHRSKSRLRT